MAIVKLKKIELIFISKHKETILEKLQNLGFLEIVDMDEKKGQEEEKSNKKYLHSLQKTELELANTQYAINMLGKYAKKPSLFKPFLNADKDEIAETAQKEELNETIKKCVELEDKAVNLKNKIKELKDIKALLMPWFKLKTKMSEPQNTSKTKSFFGSIGRPAMEKFEKEINENIKLAQFFKINEDLNNVYINVIYFENHDTDEKIKTLLSASKFSEIEFPKENMTVREFIGKIEKETEEATNDLYNIDKDLKKLAKNSNDLKLKYEYLNWKKEKLDTLTKIEKTGFSTIIKGWIPASKKEKLTKELEKISKEYFLTEIQPEEGEKIPTLIKNNSIFDPFESVTKIYGTPQSTDVDPTPFLSIFFIIYFALCLTDAGYGLIIFLACSLALKFIQFPDGLRKMIKLLAIGGFFTIIIGAMFGGWFSIDPASVPKSLTYTTASGEIRFLLQIVNPITQPLVVLVLAACLGFTQILFGVYIKFIHSLKTGNKLEALLDSGTWAFTLTGIGFYICSITLNIPEIGSVIGKYWIYTGLISLVLTQGRSKKSFLGKLFSGTINLYNLVGYLSDVLSYSRLLALGLATTIIGVAVNTISGIVLEMIPYVGWIFMLIILIGGHIFNLGINALGSFIHSGRLQFVEFFGKFLEGGGKEFKPFNKKTKYTLIKN